MTHTTQHTSHVFVQKSRGNPTFPPSLKKPENIALYAQEANQEREAARANLINSLNILCAELIDLQKIIQNTN